MYKFDLLTTSLVILGVMFSLYITTFERSVLSIFPAILLISGLVLFMMFGERLYRGEPSLGRVGYYSLIGLAGGFLIMSMVPRVFAGNIIKNLAINTGTAVILAILMAIAEEIFFRGFLFSFFMGYTNSMIASNILQAVLWASYHSAVYGYNPILILSIMIIGVIFGWIDYRCSSLSPSLIAHVVINFIASGGLAW